jgi:hypothetical protein
MSELLPGKLVPVERTVLGHGSHVLSALVDGPLTYGQLWVGVRSLRPELTYEQFVDSVTLLFIAGLVADRDGAVERTSP